MHNSKEVIFMEKIKKTSRIIDRVLSVLFWLTAVIAVSAVVFFAVVLLKGDSVFSGADSEIILGNYRITLAETVSYQMRPISLISIINVALAGAFTCYAIRVLKQIFQPMSQGLPFSCSVSKSIRKIAWVQLIYGIINVVLETITNAVFYRALDIASLFNPEKVTACNLSIVSDGSFLIWFVVLLLLSRVFQYGETLQQLSDETL